MRLDIVLRGQSNALLLREIVLRQQDGWTGGDQLVAEVQLSASTACRTASRSSMGARTRGG
jgi:hypothetical protein